MMPYMFCLRFAKIANAAAKEKNILQIILQ